MCSKLSPTLRNTFISEIAYPSYALLSSLVRHLPNCTMSYELMKERRQQQRRLSDTERTTEWPDSISSIISGVNHVGSLCSASITVESAERPTFREKVRPDPSRRLDVELHVAGPCCCQHQGVICKYASWLNSNMSSLGSLIDEQSRVQERFASFDESRVEKLKFLRQWPGSVS